MTTIDAVFLSLGSAILLALFARRLAIPYPAVLVVGGLAVATIPGVPLLAIQPSIILSIFLPAVLFQEASHISWRDMRSKALSIGLLSPILVIGTCAAVAGVAVLLFPGIPIAVAIVIGAIIAPADSVASKAVLERLKVSRRIITMLSGEGLMNDAVAVIIYKLAVAAVLGAVVSMPTALGAFARLTGGGIAFGVLIGWVGARLLAVSGEHMIYSLLSLTLAFGTYIGAEAIGVSGALATVAAGLMCSLRSASFPAEFRFNADAIWQVAIFGLNALGFLLIGVQLPTVVADLRFYAIADLIAYAAAVSAAVLIVRLLAVVAFAGVSRMVAGAGKRGQFSWREDVVIGWSGMRGLVSLAIALGLPPTVEGSVFPYRDLALFLAFAVILFTLIAQGLSLAGIVRLLHVDNDEAEREKQAARLAAAEAALTALDGLAQSGDTSTAASEPVRLEYLARIAHLGGSHAESSLAPSQSAVSRLRLTMIGAERQELLRLGRDRRLDDDVLRELLRELDVAEIALNRRVSAGVPGHSTIN